MSTLSINPASADERVTIENLLQLYTHDFSERGAGTDRGDVDDAGRNVAALDFWRRAVSTCPTARDLTERDVTSDSWNGPILRFLSV